MDRRTPKTHLFISITTLIGLVLVLNSNPFGYPDKSYKQYNPPDWYELVWGLTWEQCTSKFKPMKSYSYSSIKWYIVDAPHFNSFSVGDTAKAVIGLTMGNKVFLAKPYINDIETVSHEMIHAQGIHVGPYNPHPPIFEECSECIKSLIASTVYGSPARCFGNSDTLTIFD